MAHDVFISYSSKDKSVADGLCAVLEQSRIRCWIAPRDVIPGLAYSGQIVRAIETCRVMVLIFSANSNASDEVLREVQLASRNRRHIVNFRIEGVAVCADLDYYLSVPHWLDALTTPMERHYRQLSVSVNALLDMEESAVPVAGGEPVSEPFPQPGHSRPSTPKPPPRTAYYGIAGLAILCAFGLLMQSILRNPEKRNAGPKSDSGNETSEGGQAMQTDSRSRDRAPVETTGIASIHHKLRNIILPVVNVEEATVEETLDFLRLRSSELDDEETDPAKKGVNFIIRRPKGSTPNPGTLPIKELRLKNVPLAVALKYVCDQAKLRYEIDDYAVTLMSATETGEELFTRKFRVPANFFTRLEQALAAGNRNDQVDPFKGGADDPFGGPSELDLLKECGVSFPEGTSVSFLAASETLVVCNTPTNLDRIEELIQVTINR